MVRYSFHQFLSAAVALVPGLVLAESPAVGEVQRLKAITFSVKVGSTDKDSKRVTYTPPPGWYVRSHWVEAVSRHGNVSFSVSTVPQRWRWSSDERLDEAKRFAFDTGVEAHKVGGQARVQQQRSSKVSGLQTVRATHHALVLDVAAKGEGLFKGGAGLDLIIMAELVYVGSAESRSQYAAADGVARLGEPIATPE